MSQLRKDIPEIKTSIKMKNKNIGNLNCMTLFVPSGMKTMVIFLNGKILAPFCIILKGCGSWTG
jgi:hypothetical protein